MSSSNSNPAALKLEDPSSAPREPTKDAARRALEELLAEQPDLLEALSGLLAPAAPDAREGGAGRAPLALAQRLERAQPVSAPAEGPPHVCSWCRRVRITAERWVPAADYAREHGIGRRSAGAGVLFQLATNGICPDCYRAVVGHGHGCSCGHGHHD